MFKPNESTAATNNNARNFEKAKGFLNLYLPSRDGRRVKLGAIPLKESDERQKALIEALMADSNLVQAIISKLEIDFQPVVEGEGNLFDLG